MEHARANPLAASSGPERVLVLGPLVEHIRAEAERACPAECCGILLGVADGHLRFVRRMIRCRNMRAAECGRYAIDPEGLIAAQREARENHLEILGFYHSHPDHPAEPSSTDAAEAYWEGCSYVIASLTRGKAGEVRSFQLQDGKFAPEKIV